ncbi:hypothetical protein [Flavobacterium piscis]|uniref:Nucleotidyltransferase n=1 Tax=Flavobacterium piscis TaxID=1114874 RepID=A0ABU1Y7C5_9FLAO|nr:hypothetical protein [Flavobacterium piscis]MDR7210132.1 putative nucleotidyltransferase [Flavobacterium piscis]
MKNSEKYHKWISKNINTEHFFLAFIFGSVARNVEKPNDCDLFLVTKHKTNSDLWKTMRLENENLKNNFFECFDLELSIQLFSKDEFNEELSFIKLTLERQKTLIIDELNIK